MKDKLIKKYIEHLEFLGYEVEIKKEMIKVSNSIKVDFIILEFKGGLSFQCYLKLNNVEADNHNKLLELVNNLNLDSNISTFIVSENSLIIMYWFFEEYKKVTFGNIMALWESDLSDSIYKNEDLKIYLELNKE